MNMNVWQVRVVQVLLVVALVMWLLGGCAATPEGYEPGVTLRAYRTDGVREWTQPNMEICRHNGSVLRDAQLIIRWVCDDGVEL